MTKKQLKIKIEQLVAEDGCTFGESCRAMYNAAKSLGELKLANIALKIQAEHLLGVN